MNLAIIKHKNLNDYKTLLVKLNNLRQQCNFNNIYINTPIKNLNLPITFYIIYNSKKEFDENNKNFFIDLEIIAHLKIIDNTKNYKYSVSPSTNIIKSPIKNNNFLEIYDICVNTNYRNKKIISTLLKQIIQNSKKNLWLGVDVNNIYFSQAIKSYINAGFKNPQLKNYTLNNEIMPFYFIELTTKKNSKSKKYIDKEFMINLSNNLRNFINLVNSHICKLNIFLSVDLTNLLNEFLNYDVEVAGSFQKYNKNSHNIIQNIELLFNKNNLVYGNESYSVNTPKDSEFSFHVHPSICYEKYKCFIGWPSAMDMNITIEDVVFYNLKCHMVISVEGIYFLSLTPEFQYFLMVLQQSQDEFNYIFPILQKNIINIFTEKEQLRVEDYSKINLLKYDEVFELSEYDKNIIYKRWEYITNNLNIKDVFNNKKYFVDKLQQYKYVLDGLNFKLYNAKLIKWNTIGKTDGINIYLEYISDKCNIITTEVNNYIEMLIS